MIDTTFRDRINILNIAKDILTTNFYIEYESDKTKRPPTSDDLIYEAKKLSGFIYE